MRPDIELTPDGRLLERRQIETPSGLREKVIDLTDEAHHWLYTSVAMQDGVCLSAIFELLRANPTLQDIYKHNWATHYVARYEAIRSGDVEPDPREDADLNEPPIEALVLSLHQEIWMPSGLLEAMVATRDSKPVSVMRYLNLINDGPSQGEGADRRLAIKDYASHWEVSGRSAPFAQDTELWGTQYKSGSHINYSVSFSFDRCIDLPLRIGAGCVTLTISGPRRKDRTTVVVPLGTDQHPPSITLHELIGAITDDFSFHGGPEETQSEKQKLCSIMREFNDELHAEDMTYGLSRLSCPDDNFHQRDAHAQALQDRTRYWDHAMVMEHTGWTEAEIQTRRRQGRLLQLRAWATRTTPRQDGYPAEQFIPGFDVELMRFLNWIASHSCSDWATHQFLTQWTTANFKGTQINGWAALALPDAPIEHVEMSDENLKGFGAQRVPMRPVFTPDSPKGALVDAFEAFAAQRRRDHEQRDELEDEDED